MCQARVLLYANPIKSQALFSKFYEKISPDKSYLARGLIVYSQGFRIMKDWEESRAVFSEMVASPMENRTS